MGHIGKKRSVVSTTVSDEIAAEFERRAEALGKTKGAYLRDILVDWYNRGAPPVGKLDALIQESEAGTPKAEATETKAERQKRIEQAFDDEIEKGLDAPRIVKRA